MWLRWRFLTGLLLAIPLLPAPLAHAAPPSSFLSQLGASAPPGVSPLNHQLQLLAPSATPQALAMAAQALACADPGAERLAVIDYSLPSTEERLWVFDLHQNRLLFKELVSHGRGSGDAEARLFSNTPESFQSSLGLFRTMNSYYGRNGYSLRLDGLEADVNDLAFDRAIVIHGASYVSEEFIAQTGRLGRSHGCPAVREDITYPLIDSLKENQYVFAYYPDAEWLASSARARCPVEAPYQLAASR
ncbi:MULTISPECIES: murein L,D-transpeptidase catalytic domain family protein [unclassified Halomonas]|uniref:murein L,D-transpeptidase catalytic domain family protein n=1 Tax=unclassified Halomonas TaxID=2609666 RepID=UPI0020A079C2|nr:MULTISPECIES: murein L,D-transpeptidase catalytic domain family protein [unclassified Halomonas]MCP1316090.1 murein L,D-transpeptidase catalytic domain family protein [Halomonas sp. 707D7]MCP1326936.1 murein L,D-transpeptidase catalytic domain family protein [Halomonas sp. 707D4]